PSASLVAEPHFRLDRAADLWSHDQRHAPLGPAVRLHGLHHGARGAGGPHVPQRAASFRRVPASLAVTTLLVCAFWGIASCIVGCVVVRMGVTAMRPMPKAGSAVKLASGAITAGGTLGILIPPSVMLIVYAAVAGQSIVKLYAAAMLPGFFLTFLYLV